MARLALTLGFVSGALMGALAQPLSSPAPLALPLVAGGNEPGWRLEITDRRISLEADYGSTKVSMPTRASEPVPGGRRYAGNADGRVLVVTVLDQVCADTMTGMPRPHTVTVTLDEEVLRGCGGEPR